LLSVGPEALGHGNHPEPFAYLPPPHVARTLGGLPPVLRTSLDRGPRLLRARGLSVTALVARAKRRR